MKTIYQNNIILQINWKLAFFNKKYTNYDINDIEFQSKEKIKLNKTTTTQIKTKTLETKLKYFV